MNNFQRMAGSLHPTTPPPTRSLIRYVVATAQCRRKCAGNSMAGQALVEPLQENTAMKETAFQWYR
jgi:hypothetical protein